MTTFLTAILSFPTVVFTVPMALAALYWLLVVVGAADLDLGGHGLDGAADAAAHSLDGAADAAAHGLDGAADAAAHSLDGAADAAAHGLDGAADAAAHGLDGATDAAAHGLGGAADATAHGAADAAAHGAADAAAHGAADATTHAADAGAFGLIHALKLRNAPITVVASLFSAYGWLLTGVGGQLFFGDSPPPLLAGLGILLVSAPASLLLTSLTVRPLGVIFQNEGGVSRKHFLGNSATVTTGRVDGRFGQALYIHTGAELVLQVRCDRPNTLKKGDEILLVSFDNQREAFVVEPLHSGGQRAASTPTHRDGRAQSWNSTS